MHNVRLLLAKFDRAGPLHNFFRHDVTPFVRPQEKERVIGIHPSTIAKPADAPVRNELMHPALILYLRRISLSRLTHPGSRASLGTAGILCCHRVARISWLLLRVRLRLELLHFHECPSQLLILYEQFADPLLQASKLGLPLFL